MRTIGHEELKQMLDRQAPFRLVMAQEMGRRNIKRFLSGEKAAGIVRCED